DYLRLLFARAGVTRCPTCGGVVRKDTVDEVADRVRALGEGVRFQVMFPLAVAEKASNPDRTEPKSDARPSGGAFEQRLFSLRQRGFNRLWQAGKVVEFSVPESLLEIDFSQPVFVLVDRLAVSPDMRQRLIDSVEICFRESGEALIEPAISEGVAGPERLVFNERFECKRCRTVFQEPEPRLFSFNNPFGACPRCQGFGNTTDLDLDRVIPDQTKSLAEGAIEPWTKPRYREFFSRIKRQLREHGIPVNVPYGRLTPAQRDWLIEGGDDFMGVRGFFRALEHKKYKLHIRVFLSHYRGYTVCPECRGARLRPEALNVRIEGKNIAEVCRMTASEVSEFLRQARFSPAQKAIADEVLGEIRSRLRFLEEAGLEYLTLDRLASTLSGGESQRIQLATSLGANLVGALYVLDEPSIGLHPRDTDRLSGILRRLRDLGNTILVVEHDPAMMRQADKIIDLGPGAGEHGGRVVFAGPLSALTAHPRSLTGRYLSGELQVPVPHHRRPPGRRCLTIRGARQHNLKSIDVAIPLGLLTCVSGVSGSGKSTLVHCVLYNALVARRGAVVARPECDGIEGASALSGVVLVDQSPLGRTPRSNPVTYVKAFDEIRRLFAETPEARKRGLTAGNFSFNVPGGRCEVCQGEGTVTVEMQVLADVELVCEECRGRRFKSSVLEVTYRRKNIADVLQMTVREALVFFAGTPKIRSKLRVLDEVGLGYLRLGQSATTLSGGEAQRVRLAAHLAFETSAGVLFIFDEPTTGLHFDDVNKLLSTLRKLLDSGATVLVIEHNLDVLKSADWIIDLGPGGGEAGGRIVAAGPPEEVAQQPASITGKFLAPLLFNH
ncbi:MAG: excinuclease ABC subunit UvrA, partial [Terriglobia bacterium]